MQICHRKMHSESVKCQNFPACGGLIHPNTSKYYKIQLCSTESNVIQENRAPKARENFSRKPPLLKKTPPCFGGLENKGGFLTRITTDTETDVNTFFLDILVDVHNRPLNPRPLSLSKKMDGFQKNIFRFPSKFSYKILLESVENHQKSCKNK